MSRQQGLLLGILGVLILLVVFYMLLFRPKQEELADIEAQIEEAIAQEATLETRVAALEEVRARAPEIEASLASAESVVPRDQALPSALRQLQLAADDSGVELVSVGPARPAAVAGEIPELASLALTVQLNGGYFQVVDFLRRVEDPAIVPRGLEWRSASVAAGEYPVLSVTLTGEMYALLPSVVIEAPEPEAPTPTETPEEDAA